MRAPVILAPAEGVEYTRLLVPVVEGLPSDEAMEVAARLASERRARIVAITVLEVPLHLPLDAELPTAEGVADAALDEARAIGDSYGVDVITRIVRGRRAGRAIVDEAMRRNAEIVVYCASSTCDSSTQVGERLVELGYRNVCHYVEGKRDWVEARLPLERGGALKTRFR